jgi:hypothetical protein
MTARPRRANEGRALRLASWNANSDHGRKLKLDQIRSEHGDICLLNEKHLEQDLSLCFVNYLCLRTDLSAPGGGTAILVRRRTDQYTLNVSVLQQMNAIATSSYVSVRKQVSKNRGFLPLTRLISDRVAPDTVSEYLTRG